MGRRGRYSCPNSKHSEVAATEVLGMIAYVLFFAYFVHFFSETEEESALQRSNVAARQTAGVLGLLAVAGVVVILANSAWSAILDEAVTSGTFSVGAMGMLAALGVVAALFVGLTIYAACAAEPGGHGGARSNVRYDSGAPVSGLGVQPPGYHPKYAQFWSEPIQDNSGVGPVTAPGKSTEAAGSRPLGPLSFYTPGKK